MTGKRIVRSSCRMCHGVCQVLVHMEGDRVVKVTGDPESPISRGYICPKGGRRRSCCITRIDCCIQCAGQASEATTSGNAFPGKKPYQKWWIDSAEFDRKAGLNMSL